MTEREKVAKFMAKHSENFPLVIGGAILGIWYLFNSIYENLFYGVVKEWIERHTGIQEAQVIAGLSQVIIPLSLAICIV